MGLDMAIYSVTKVHMDDERIYRREDVDGIVLSEEDITEPRYSQLSPYTQVIKVRNRYYDFEKIRADFGLSDNSYIAMMTRDQTIFRDPANQKEVTISQADIKYKYTIERVEQMYVCKADEVICWRKAYDIQDWFHDHIDGDVEDTGYYILSGGLLLDFNAAFPDDRVAAIAPTDEEALFYWEWY